MSGSLYRSRIARASIRPRQQASSQFFGATALRLPDSARSTPAASFSGRAAIDLFCEATLIQLCNQRAFRLIAAIQERQAEGVTNIAEDPCVLRPRDHGTRRHHRGNLAVDECGARQSRERNHLADGLASFGGV